MMMNVPSSPTTPRLLVLALTLSASVHALAPAQQQQNYHQSYTAYNNNNNDNNRVELRQDPFGGTGLFATAAIPQGDRFSAVPKDQIVFSQIDETDSNPISECVKSFVIGRNSFTESVSIGGQLASWKLLQQQQQHASSPVSMDQAGISKASAGHAATLPWDKALWQLPVVWPDDILQEALNYGYDQVVLGDPSTNTEQQQTIQEACQDAKSRVSNFQSAAVRLAEELGPTLKEQCQMDIADDHHNNPYSASSLTTDDISLACHQAMALTFSRTFFHPQSGETTMLPTIDSANHVAQPNSAVKKDRDNEGGILLVAQQDIQEGDEITITYGLEDMALVMAFSGYGFVPENMAQESPAGRALQLAAVKGQEMAKEKLEQQQQQQQHYQQQYHQ